MQKQTYKLFGKYFLRTPLLPFNFYLELTKEPVISENKLKEMFADKVINEAIFLASPELHSQINRWIKDEITDLKKIKRLQFSLLKYITRICSRSTPFGLFASCSIGEFSSQTIIQLNKVNKYRRCSRFDMTFLVVLAQELSKDKELMEYLLFFPNSSLYKTGHHYRYVEYTIQNNRRQYTLEGLMQSKYLDIILNKSKDGKTIEELALSIVEDGISIKESKTFVNMLIENQILVSELEPSLTGIDYLDRIINRLNKIPKFQNLASTLEQNRNSLKQIDEVFGNNVTEYEKLFNTIKQLKIPIDKKYLIQTDTFSTASRNILDYRLKKDLKKAISLLNKITLSYGNERLNKFKIDFIKRYESREIPLVIALDTEIGIGYSFDRSDDNELIDDLKFQESNKDYKNVIWNKFDDVLLKKVIGALDIKEYKITLTENDFISYSEDWSDLPDTLSSIIEIIQIDNSIKICMNSVGGSSAANLLARFTHGDEELYDFVEKIIETEDKMNPQKVLAEIIHLPQARIGNVLHRKVSRSYEIPYLARTHLSFKKQIPIDDILISVKADKIYLRSKKLNCQVIPYLTNAHRFDFDALPIYNFLCDIQTQNKRSAIGFKWNTIFQKFSFLPRVKFNNIILSRARWRFFKNNISAFLELEKNDLILEIGKWSNKYGLPRFVELVEGDNKLLIDLKNLTSVEMLLYTVKNKDEFIIEEFLFGSHGIVKQNSDYYCNQFIVSFYNEKKLKTG